MDRQQHLEDLILELLTCGPSSFAAIYGFVIRQGEINRPPVVEVLEVTDRCQGKGWIRALQMTPDGSYREVSDVDRVRAAQGYSLWLNSPTADLSVDALSIDEIGLWFEILSEGRDEWERRAAKGHPPSPAFTVDFDSSTGDLSVHAHDPATAERVAAEWLKLHPEIGIVTGTSSMTAASGFVLRDGTVVKGGVHLKSRCAVKEAR